MATCNFCGYNRAKPTDNGVRCGKCGIEEYYPIKRGRLNRSQPTPIHKRLMAYALFKLYKWSVQITRMLSSESPKPRFGDNPKKQKRGRYAWQK